MKKLTPKDIIDQGDGTVLDTTEDDPRLQDLIEDIEAARKLDTTGMDEIEIDEELLGECDDEDVEWIEDEDD